MRGDVKSIIRDIKSLKIQGARNVARAALSAVELHLVKKGEEDLDIVIAELKKTRPTEPMMRNLLDEIAVLKGKKQILAHIRKRRKELERALDKISQYGSKLIGKNSVVVTHCHSSTVTSLIAAARSKKPRVICFETRPLYQGRKTAEELASLGIDVSMAVDGYMAEALKKADVVFVGADSININGDLINKIGTGVLARLAYYREIPFYVAAETLKINRETRYGIMEEIEYREGKEIWKNPPPNLTLLNPAFERVPSRYITAFITEKGIYSPSQLASVIGVG